MAARTVRAPPVIQGQIRPETGAGAVPVGGALAGPEGVPPVAGVLAGGGAGGSSGVLAMGVETQVPSGLKRYSTDRPSKEKAFSPDLMGANQARNAASVDGWKTNMGSRADAGVSRMPSETSDLIAITGAVGPGRVSLDGYSRNGKSRSSSR